jgi:hypothetical protein
MVVMKEGLLVSFNLTLCPPYHTLYTPHKEGLSTLYQASKNYQNPYFLFVAIHQAQYCALVPPHQNLRHCDLHHPNLYRSHIHRHVDYTSHLEYPYSLLPSHLCCFLSQVVSHCA